MPDDIKHKAVKINAPLKTLPDDPGLEKEIRNRLTALRHYLRMPGRDPHISLEEIYRARPYAIDNLLSPFRRIMNRFGRRRAPEREKAPPA